MREMAIDADAVAMGTIASIRLTPITLSRGPAMLNCDRNRRI
jgi:hypothetical protein